MRLIALIFINKGDLYLICHDLWQNEPVGNRGNDRINPQNRTCGYQAVRWLISCEPGLAKTDLMKPHPHPHVVISQSYSDL